MDEPQELRAQMAAVNSVLTALIRGERSQDLLSVLLMLKTPAIRVSPACSLCRGRSLSRFLTLSPTHARFLSLLCLASLSLLRSPLSFGSVRNAF